MRQYGIRDNSEKVHSIHPKRHICSCSRGQDAALVASIPNITDVTYMHARIFVVGCDYLPISLLARLYSAWQDMTIYWPRASLETYIHSDTSVSDGAQ